jgi:putative N6-adenine-specific DNA methylase
MDLFVTCAQYLEPLLAEELGQLGFIYVEAGFRGVYVKNVNIEAIYRINYLSRLGGRVLMPLASFRCYEAKSLYGGIIKVDWLKYILRGKTFAIDANVSHPRLRNSLFAAQVAKDAICDQLRDRIGSRPNIDIQDPDVQLNLYIHDQWAVMSLDTSGKPLSRRGYRLETVEAPMQETLAAALLMLAKYQGNEILCDPCCGSGTILIEAALMASRTPPGFLRKEWGFFNLPEFSQIEWLKVKNEADAKKIDLPKQHIFGCDINKQAIHATKVNTRATGWHQHVEVVHCDFREFTPAIVPSLVVTNPPHGRRLEEEESLRPLYRSLGDFLKRKTSKPAKGFVFTGSPMLSKEVGLAAKRRYVLDNSGIESRLLEYDLF